MNGVNSYKVVLLGRAKAGKTSLLERYKTGTFQCQTQTTIGATVAHQTVELVGGCVSLHIWDTAGSERFLSMTKSYYRKAKAAIVCFDLTEWTSFVTARYWVSELLSTEKDCKIYLCGTKKDIVDQDPSRREVQQTATQTLAEDLGSEVIEVSSKSGENVEFLFEKIATDFTELNEKIEVIDENGVNDAVKLHDWENNSVIGLNKRYARCCSH